MFLPHSSTDCFDGLYHCNACELALKASSEDDLDAGLTDREKDD